MIKKLPKSMIVSICENLSCYEVFTFLRVDKLFYTLRHDKQMVWNIDFTINNVHRTLKFFNMKPALRKVVLPEMGDRSIDLLINGINWNPIQEVINIPDDTKFLNHISNYKLKSISSSIKSLWKIQYDSIIQLDLSGITDGLTKISLAHFPRLESLTVMHEIAMKLDLENLPPITKFEVITREIPIKDENIVEILRALNSNIVHTLNFVGYVQTKPCGLEDELSKYKKLMSLYLESRYTKYSIDLEKLPITITHLFINQSINCESLIRFQKLKKLGVLSLSNCEKMDRKFESLILMDPDPHPFKNSILCSSLKVLDISTEYEYENCIDLGDILTVLDICPSLKELAVNVLANSTEYKCVKTSHIKKELSALEKLSFPCFQDFSIDNIIIEILNNFSFPNIEYLHIMSITNSRILYGHFPKLKKLLLLTSGTDDDMKTLSTFPNLRFFQLENINILPNVVFKLLGEFCPRLNELLMVTDEDISADSLIELFTKCKELLSFTPLWSNYIDIDVLNKLSESITDREIINRYFSFK